MPHFDLQEIKSSISENGFWETQDEWRIFTATTFRITLVEQLDEKNQTKHLIYLVRVSCDYDFRCECPTIQRAVEFCAAFQSWIEEGFSHYGWPSWVEKNKPQL